MSQSRENTPIEPHTEYTHARFRCPRCGTSVPRGCGEEILCVRCEEAE